MRLVYVLGLHRPAWGCDGCRVLWLEARSHVGRLRFRVWAEDFPEVMHGPGRQRRTGYLYVVPVVD